MGHARDWLALHFASLEPAEGMNAFVEKRQADRIGLRRRAAEGGSSEFMWGPNKVTCPSCGTRYLPTAFRFCGVCGSRLDQEVTVATTGEGSAGNGR